MWFASLVGNPCCCCCCCCWSKVLVFCFCFRMSFLYFVQWNWWKCASAAILNWWSLTPAMQQFPRVVCCFVWFEWEFFCRTNCWRYFFGDDAESMAWASWWFLLIIKYNFSLTRKFSSSSVSAFVSFVESFTQLNFFFSAWSMSNSSTRKFSSSSVSAFVSFVESFTQLNFFFSSWSMSNSSFH